MLFVLSQICQKMRMVQQLKPEMAVTGRVEIDLRATSQVIIALRDLAILQFCFEDRKIFLLRLLVNGVTSSTPNVCSMLWLLRLQKIWCFKSGSPDNLCFVLDGICVFIYRQTRCYKYNVPFIFYLESVCRAKSLQIINLGSVDIHG